jgi:hypothetical protein
MSDDFDFCTTNGYRNDSRTANGAAVHMHRTAHGGWRATAPASLPVYDADDFELLRTGGKVRTEELSWISAVHDMDTAPVAKFGIQYAGNMAIGAPTGAVSGPRNPSGSVGSDYIDPTMVFARRNTVDGVAGGDPTFGVDSLPLADVNVAGEATSRFITAPWGEYDVMLPDGRMGSRLQLWAWMDMCALNEFFDEACSTAASGPYAAAHDRRVHYPWVQIKNAVNEASLEYSRDYETAATLYPSIEGATTPLLGTDDGVTFTWTTNAPPTTGAGGTEWNPLLDAGGAAVTGRFAAVIYDRRDGLAANNYEVRCVSQVQSAGGAHTSGTFTVQPGTLGKFGPPGRIWEQNEDNDIRIALCKWVGATDDWVGTPGLTGDYAEEPCLAIARDGTFELTVVDTCLPIRVYSVSSFFAHAWDARRRAAAGETVEWVTAPYNDTYNVPEKGTYTWDGDETEQECEEIIWSSWRRHIIDSELMVAERMGPDHIEVVYLGSVMESKFAYRWNGSAMVSLTEAWVDLQAKVKPIPDGAPLDEPCRRTYVGVEWPAIAKQTTSASSVCQGVMFALMFPELYDPDYHGYARRFAFGVTHVQSITEDAGATWDTPWEVDPGDYGMWALLRKYASNGSLLHPSRLVFQFKGSTYLDNGKEVLHTMEDVTNNPSDIHPTTIEGPSNRLSSTADIADYASSYGRWTGRTIAKQQEYLIGSTDAFPSVDQAWVAEAPGRFMRTDTAYQDTLG